MANRPNERHFLILFQDQNLSQFQYVVSAIRSIWRIKPCTLNAFFSDAYCPDNWTSGAAEPESPGPLRLACGGLVVYSGRRSEVTTHPSGDDPSGFLIVVAGWVRLHHQGLWALITPSNRAAICSGVSPIST